MKVSKETNIAELTSVYPRTAEVFAEYGLHCVGCMAAAFDTIAQGAILHGLSEGSIKNLVEDLNLVVSENAQVEKDEIGPENKENETRD